MLTGEQVRAARGMLRLNQRQFAEMTHLPMRSIQRFERTRGPIIAAETIIEVLRASIENAGIELIEPGLYTGIGGPGVRLRGEPVVGEEIIDLDTAADTLDPPEAVATPRPS